MRMVVCALSVVSAILVGHGASSTGWSPLPVSLTAHNCYPDRGLGVDRLARARRAAGDGRVVIEQDVAWNAETRQSVVSHETTLRGDEPTLEAHFFGAVLADLERALVEGRRERWPLMVLHLDFKTNEREHHRAVWGLLQRYQRLLSTAPRTRDASVPQAITWGPLLVLTEQGAGQERVFHDEVQIGDRLLLFGTVPPPVAPSTLSRDARFDWLATTAPSTLIPSGATNYRRWTNHSWAAVERGGPPSAGEWTADEASRLSALVERAHTLGLWIRFYTLNGHAQPQPGLSDSYNVGSEHAVRIRWDAARAAGVDLMATDQYEAFVSTPR